MRCLSFPEWRGAFRMPFRPQFDRFARHEPSMDETRLNRGNGCLRRRARARGTRDLKRMNPADAMQAGQVAHDLSLWGLFWNAHIIVKLVMVGLLAASVWCWAIIIDKTLLFARSKQAMDRFEDIFWSGQSLEDLYRTLNERQ